MTRTLGPRTRHTAGTPGSPARTVADPRTGR